MLVAINFGVIKTHFVVSKTHFQGTTILIKNLVYLQEECLEGNNMFFGQGCQMYYTGFKTAGSPQKLFKKNNCLSARN